MFLSSGYVDIALTINAIIRILTHKKEKVIDVHSELITIYVENVMSVQVWLWRKQLSEVHQDMQDEACTDWPNTVTTDITIEAVLDLVVGNL